MTSERSAAGGGDVHAATRSTSAAPAPHSAAHTLAAHISRISNGAPAAPGTRDSADTSLRAHTCEGPLYITNYKYYREGPASRQYLDNTGE